MRLDSADLLDLIRPKLEKLADQGVTDTADEDQQSLVRLMAKKYLEALSNPLPRGAPVETPQRSARPNPTGAKKDRLAGRMTLQDRIARTRAAAQESAEEMQDDEGGFADEAIPAPSASLPDPKRAIQYDEATGQPVIPVSSLRLPKG